MSLNAPSAALGYRLFLLCRRCVVVGVEYSIESFDSFLGKRTTFPSFSFSIFLSLPSSLLSLLLNFFASFLLKNGKWERGRSSKSIKTPLEKVELKRRA